MLPHSELIKAAKKNDELVEEDIVSVLDEFGQQFVELTRPGMGGSGARAQEMGVKL